MGVPVRICIITSAHPVDDVRVSQKIGQSFRVNGFQVAWVGPDHAFFDPLEITKTGYQYSLFPSGKGKSGRILNYFKLYRQTLHMKDVDVFYAPDPDAAALAIRLSRKLNAPSYLISMKCSIAPCLIIG